MKAGDILFMIVFWGVVTLGFVGAMTVAGWQLAAESAWRNAEVTGEEDR